MKHILSIFIITLTFCSFGQKKNRDSKNVINPLELEIASLSDTGKITVDLTSFKLSDKVVIAEYGKVRMFFNQQDYLEIVSIEDTVIVTPKYFNNDMISGLLKAGKVMVIQRSDQKKQTAIVHYLKEVGSMLEREFELTNGVGFFSRVEVFGLMNYNLLNHIPFDSIIKIIDDEPSKPKRCIFTNKDFEYPEDFPDKTDTKRIIIKDYFPLKPGLHLVYGNDNGYGELDDITCKTAILGEQEVFYFAEKSYQTKLVSVGTSMFGQGIYFYSGDTLYQQSVEYEEDIFLSEEDDMFHNRPEEKIMLLPPTMVPGDSIVFEDDYCTKSIIYLKNETINVKASKGKTDYLVYDDCIKLKIYSHYDNTIYNEYIWLKRGVGLVKWMRSSGRTDELVNYY